MQQALTLRHYGASSYDPAKFLPIQDWDRPARPKPRQGGLWTSPIDSVYGWKEWSDQNEYGDTSTYFDIQFHGRLLTIHGEEDLGKLHWTTSGHGKWEYPLFVPVLKQGYDAIHLTVRGQEETWFSLPRNLYGWDCETVLVLNPESLVYTPPKKTAKLNETDLLIDPSSRSGGSDKR